VFAADADVAAIAIVPSPKEKVIVILYSLAFSLAEATADF